MRLRWHIGSVNMLERVQALIGRTLYSDYASGLALKDVLLHILLSIINYSRGYRQKISFLQSELSCLRF